MQLEREKCAEEAFGTSVDLQRLFVDIVHTLILQTYAPSRGRHVYQRTPAVVELLERAQNLGYEGLSQGRWRAFAGSTMPPANPIDAIEILINKHGRYCQINSRASLEAVGAIMTELGSVVAPETLHVLLAETAVNQVFEQWKIGQVELRPMTRKIDFSLFDENTEIVKLVRGKIRGLLS